MLLPLRHALTEGRVAAQLAADRKSARRLKRDYLLSRLLRLGNLPGFNRTRTVKLANMEITYRFNRGDLQSIREVLIDECYSCELPIRPRTLLDLGANIGLFSIWAFRQFDLEQIVAVEPSKANVLLAGRNFEANGISAEVVCAAVGAHDGEACFEPARHSNLGRIVPEGSHGEKVPVVAIQKLLRRFPRGRVDLVKMDIEGGEAALLGDDVTWLNQAGALLIEWHDDRCPSKPLIANVETVGFRHRRINTNRQENLSLFVRTLCKPESPKN